MFTMKYLLLLAFAVSVSCRMHFVVDVLEDEWELFKHQYSKVYESTLEERSRKRIFLENKQYNLQHNELYELGQVSFKLGLNQFSDLLNEEFVAMMNGYNNTENNFDEEAVTFIEPDFDVPTSVDWRNKGAVTPVKYQGQCGSCWAFAATGTLEGQHFRRTGKLISLSEQNLMDCSRDYGNHGCHGGLAMNALKYVQNNRGIDTEPSYPYKAKDGGSCHYNPKNSGATDKGFGKIQTGDENALKKAVATIGPIAVSMDASPQSFKHYEKGVYFNKACSSTHLNHGVLIVGYGSTTNGQDYWIVKNSWGTHWGQNGYFLIARNKDNNCGLATRATYPIV